MDYTHAASHQDMKAAQWSADFVPVLLALLHSADVFPASAEKGRIVESAVSIDGPPCLTQLYCVYRI